MLRIPKKIRVLRALFFVGFLLALGWLAWVVRGDLQVIAGALRQLGWPQYLQASSDTWPLLQSCVGSSLCNEAFNALWADTFAMWTTLVPAAALMGMTATYTMIKKPPEKSPGLARWADLADIRSFLFPRRKKLVGFYGTPLNERSKPMVNKQIISVDSSDRFRHTVVFGGTGAGKTSGYFLPNLLLDARAGIASVVFDLKYPDDRGLLQAVDFYQAEDRPVFRFTPFDSSEVKLNPLEGIDSYNDALKMAGLIVPHEEQAHSGSFFRNLEREILAGLALGVSKDGKPSLSRMLELTQSGRQGLLTYVKNRPYLKPYFHNIFDVRADTLAGTLEGIATSHLQIFHNPMLAETLSAGPGSVSLKSDAFRDLLRDGGLFYIGIPQEELVGGGAQVLLRLLKRLLDNAILSIANQEGGTLPTPLSVYLDEFPNFGVLPAISENLATLRSRHVALHIGMQSKAQGEDVYGFSGFKAVVSNNFAQIVLFPGSLRLEENSYWAKVLGETAVVEWGRAKSREGFFDRERTTWTAREVARPLLSAEEMHNYEQGQGVVVLSNCPLVWVSLSPVGRQDHPLYASWREHLIDARCLRQSGQSTELIPTDADTPTPVDDVLEPDTTQALPLVPWLTRLAEQGTHFKGYFRQGTLTRVDVAVHEKSLAAEHTPWLEAGWLKRQGEGLSVTKNGLASLSLAESRWLKRTCRLLDWYHQHKEGQNGGLLEDGYLFVPKDAAGELGPEDGLEVRKTINNTSHVLIRFPLTPRRTDAQTTQSADVRAA